MPEDQKMVDIDTSGPGAEIEIPETKDVIIMIRCCSSISHEFS